MYFLFFSLIIGSHVVYSFIFLSFSPFILSFKPLFLICLHFPFFLTADVISTVEFNQTGDLLATGDKGGRVVIFQRETEVSLIYNTTNNPVSMPVDCPKYLLLKLRYVHSNLCFSTVDPGQSKGELEDAGETGDSGEYNVYSTFQSHEPDFDYLKSLEIEEKINKIRWLPQQNAAHFLLSTNGETRVTCSFYP